MFEELVTIVIPVYKEEPSYYETISFKQCVKILGNYSITFIIPEGLNISWYQQEANNKIISYIEFPIETFSGIEPYNRLMLSKEFYLHFHNYKYILVYQLDAYVFRDDLVVWCNKGFDFVGAPWYEHKNDSFLLSKPAGNGGFSLRRVEAFTNVLEKNKRVIHKGLDVFKPYNNLSFVHKLIKYPRLVPRLFGYKNNQRYLIKTNCLKEDLFWALIAPIIDPSFKVANTKEAIEFSFEMKPFFFMTLNNFQLPMGCHAWNLTDNILFWKNYINF